LLEEPFEGFFFSGDQQKVLIGESDVGDDELPFQLQSAPENPLLFLSTIN